MDIASGVGIAKGLNAIGNFLKEGNLAIGKMDDLRNLKAGEYSLPGQGRLPDLGSPKANWYQNAGELRKEMNLNKPIRDASANLPDNHPRVHGTFLGAERNLLRNKGWKFDPSTGYWNPPN